MYKPKTIYKFRNWTDEKHKDLLKNNIMFFASPETFNDPFDCKIPEDILSLNTDDKKEKYIQNFINGLKSTQKITKQYLIEVENDLRHNLYNDLEGFNKRLEVAENIKSDDYGVVSFSSVWDNVLLWSHYAENHRGYCLGFSEEKMRHLGIFSIMGNVNYDADYNYPRIDPLGCIWDKAIIQIMSKSKDWEYEKEYRLMKNYSPIKPSIEERKIMFPDNIIEEIIIGMNISKDHEREIIEIAKQKNIKIYKTTKIPFKFKIDRIEMT